MKVELVSYTKPTELLYNSAFDVDVDLENLISFCARVSNPSNQYNFDNGYKLIDYLIRHAHWSPFEMVNACLYIETTRDIARQILRHRSFSFQEFSQRYANPVKELEFVLREARLQDDKNRQTSHELTEENKWLQDNWNELQSQVIELSRNAYNWAIEHGIAKEQARAVLPEGLTLSRMYVNGTIRSWIHYIQVRSGNGTQKEHMEIARLCARVISSVFPPINKFVSEN